MIAAQDLMVGDWVQHASDNYFKVTRIDMWGDGSTHFACGHPHLWDYNNKFSPIPLTAEILEKNGFKRVPIDYDKEMRSECYACDGIDWVIYADQFMLCRKGDWVGLGIDITCVHELQHALRLCGIEKEIIV